MIVSHAHRFIFVHVPKCAGTTVRAALEPFDESGGLFDQRVEDHPTLGRLDYTHLPLHVLKDAAPTEFDKLNCYESYALTRDPAARFVSATEQRVKMTRQSQLAALDDDALAAEIDAIVAYLSAHDRVIEPEWIHFARQTDFVALGGERMVRRIYPVERADRLRDALSIRIGAPLEPFQRRNQRAAFAAPGLRGPMMWASRAAKRFLPEALSTALRDGARRALMRPARDDLPAPFRSSEVSAFIGDYYAEDAELHHRALIENG